MSLTAPRLAPLALVQRILLGIQAFYEFEPPLGNRVLSEGSVLQRLSEVLKHRGPLSVVQLGVCHIGEHSRERTVPNISSI